MKRFLVLLGVLAAGVVAATSEAQGSGHCWAPAPCYQVAYETRKVTCYKPVYEWAEREVTVWVCKPRYETITKDVETISCKTEWKEEPRERRVPVTLWKDETYQRCVLVPVMKDVTYERKVPVTEWKDEVREYTVLTTEWKDEPRQRTWTTCKMVPEQVVRDVVCCRPVSIPYCDPCTGCVRYCCKYESYTQQVAYTCYKPVYETHKENYVAKVAYCVPVKKSAKVKVAHCSWKTEQVKCQVCEYQQKFEPYTVKKAYCEYKTEKYTAKVAYTVPVKSVHKVSYQVCHLDKMAEKRMEKYQVCKMVAYETTVQAPVYQTVSYQGGCCETRGHGCGFFSKCFSLCGCR